MKKRYIILPIIPLVLLLMSLVITFPVEANTVTNVQSNVGITFTENTSEDTSHEENDAQKELPKTNELLTNYSKWGYSILFLFVLLFFSKRYFKKKKGTDTFLE